MGLTVKPVGEPDAGNPPVRFDEREVETEHGMRILRHERGNPDTELGRSLPHRATSRLYPDFVCVPGFCVPGFADLRIWIWDLDSRNYAKAYPTALPLDSTRKFILPFPSKIVSPGVG